MVCLGADRMLARGIEDDEVGIASYRNRSLSRIEAKQLRRRCCYQLYEAVDREPSPGNAAGIDQAHAMFHARAAVRDLRKIVATQFFLFFEAEGTMVGRNHL